MVLKKIVVNIVYWTSISVSGFFIKENLFHGSDFYLGSHIINNDFLTKQKSNHIYWKQIDNTLGWQNTLAEKHIAEDWSAVWNFSHHPKEQEIYQFISDHTFKLNSACSSGTGWILDFEIPTDNTYPKTWYIATNMHVIEKYKFLDNPYGVVLPISKNVKFSDFNQKVPEPETNQNYKKCEQLFDSGNEITLEKTSIDVDNRVILEQKDEHSWTQTLNTSASIKEIIKPKLFYHAMNFLGTRQYKNNLVIQNTENYYKDFAVLEVTFDSEETAQKITNGFYWKYYQNQNPNIRPVNVFTQELMSSVTTHEELWNIKDKEFYSGGYPENWDFYMNFHKNKKTHEVSKTTLETGKLLQYKFNNHTVGQILLNHFKEPIIGHATLNTLKTQWKKEKIKNWGYLYAIKNLYLYSGSSGSMVIDKNKNLLGLGTGSISEINVGFVEPLMSDGVFDGRKIILPKYDLIKGVPGQPMSYKSQLEKYHPQKHTYLKSLGWKSPNTQIST